MTAGVVAGASGGAAAQVIANALKAAGVIVRVECDDFIRVVEMNNEPLVVHATSGLLTTQHQYLTSYRGLAFFTRSKALLEVPAHCQVVEARKIWIPG